MGKKDKMKNKWTKLDKNEKQMDKNCQKCKIGQIGQKWKVDEIKKLDNM